MLDALTPYRWLAIAAAAAALLGLAGVQTARLASARTELANERQTRADERAAGERRAREQSEAYRAIEQQRLVDQQEGIRNAEKATSLARADAAAARDAHDRLQQRATGLAAAARRAATCDPGATVGGPPGVGSADLLADVLGQADAAAGELAAALDAARIAGQLCERSYDALMPSTP